MLSKRFSIVKNNFKYLLIETITITIQNTGRHYYRYSPTDTQASDSD